MPKESNRKLDLSQLAFERPGLSQIYGAMLAEAATVCLEEEGHDPGVAMPTKGDFSEVFELEWGMLSSVAGRTYADEPFTTEQGAYGIAALIVEALTGLTVVERSKKGTGFDYWLGDKDSDGDLFQSKARLEVSGIRRGDGAAVKARVRRKIGQTQPSDSTGLPAIVLVVEFGTPHSRIATRRSEVAAR